MYAMNRFDFVVLGAALAPAALMTLGAMLFSSVSWREETVWKLFRVLLTAALAFTLVQPLLHGCAPSSISTGGANRALPWVDASGLTVWMAALVQLLGSVIGVFSTRYLQGEQGVGRYACAFAGVLASVHLLLLANHWLVLIGAWAAVGFALQHLLCFYPERSFALLAAHKKQIADRLADVLLFAAATLAWTEVDSGLLTDLRAHLEQYDGSIALQASAVCMVLAVILRTALFPVHGWLIQVMEAPTPVSALMHAGVVNLGGYQLIRSAPLLEVADVARWLLVAFGLSTAVLAGLVMLTRISVKVRLAWSTVAQMGFMILECGLGLYTLAALHLVGHSLYKAHAFLSASSIVRETRLHMMHGRTRTTASSHLLAPAACLVIVAVMQDVFSASSWPWWWSGILALAWAPLLWLPAVRDKAHPAPWGRIMFGCCLVVGLTAAALLSHALPLGVDDAPFTPAGWLALVGMASMYFILVGLQRHPRQLSTWRRWSYAGFYVDEFYTRFALWLWPASWTPAASNPHLPLNASTQPVAVDK